MARAGFPLNLAQTAIDAESPEALQAWAEGHGEDAPDDNSTTTFLDDGWG